MVIPIWNIVQLDDVVLVKTSLSDRSAVTIYGIVDGLIARHEGAKLDSERLPCRAGRLAVNTGVKAHVTVTRVEPKIFVPPLPGQPVYRAAGLDRDRAVFFDAMQ